MPEIRIIRFEGQRRPDGSVGKGDIQDWRYERRNRPDAEVRAELEKLIAAATPWVAPKTAADSKFEADESSHTHSPGDAIVTRFSEIEAQPVEWLWRGWIPFGALSVYDGDPGLGKSTTGIDWAARLSRGDLMPDYTPGPEAAGTVMLSAEDDAARVIRPRLEAAGAVLERIATVEVCGQGDEKRDPTICRADLLAVEKAIAEVGARLVIIDPLMAYLPADVNAHRDQDVRRALAELRALAERTGAAVVVIRHLNKSPGGNSLYRGGGSIGIIGAARSGLVLARNPDDADSRVLAITKCNLAAPPPALGLKLVVEPGHASPRVRWDDTPSTHTADSLLAVPIDPEERSALDDAVAFLRDILDSGSKPARDVEQEAKNSGIRPPTLRRARLRAGVVSRKVGAPGGMGQHWVLELPAKVISSTPKALNTPLDEHLRLTRDGKPLCGANQAEGAHLGKVEHLREHLHVSHRSVPDREDEADDVPLTPTEAEIMRGLEGGRA